MWSEQSKWSNIFFITISHINCRPIPLNRYFRIELGYGLHGGELEKAFNQMTFESDELKYAVVDRLGINPVDIN